MDILLHSFIGGFYYSWQNVKSDFILFIPLSGVTHESGPINKSSAYRSLPPPYPSSVAPHSASTAAAATPLLCHPMSDAAARWGFNFLRRVSYCLHELAFLSSSAVLFRLWVRPTSATLFAIGPPKRILHVS